MARAMARDRAGARARAMAPAPAMAPAMDKKAVNNFCKVFGREIGSAPRWGEN
jgi:hypothetical protein